LFTTATHGKGVHLLKINSKRRRTKEEIQAAKQAKSQDTGLGMGQVERIQQLEQSLAASQSEA